MYNIFPLLMRVTICTLLMLFRDQIMCYQLTFNSRQFCQAVHVLICDFIRSHNMPNPSPVNIGGSLAAQI